MTCATSSAAKKAPCGGVADRIVGSPEIYGHEEREAEQSVNFVTCHDGFTLNDLVSYDQKHNLENGEDNRDGATITTAGTAVSRARRMTQRSRSYAIGRSRTLLTQTVLRWACR